MGIDLKEVAKEINELLENRRKELELTFIEESHIYYMKDVDGKIRNNFPSVSKVLGKFYTHFDGDAKALQMAKGDVKEQQRLLTEWKLAGDVSTNQGSRVHYHLECELVKQYGNYKEVRQPIFECGDEQIRKGDKMIEAGKDYLKLMHERGAVLLDTEIVLGDNILCFTGQPDKMWLMLNKEKNSIGIVTTDWKTNKIKNFTPQWYNKYLYPPFNKYRDYALTHYYLQLPLYSRLLKEMLKGTKYEDILIMGGVVVLLKDDGTYNEYKVQKEINDTILTMDLTKYLK